TLFHAKHVNDDGTLTPIDTPEEYKAVTEDHWVSVPAGSKIERQFESNGKEHWIYPKGMELVHRFFVTGGKLFQLRLMKKMAGQGWGFGEYEPDDSGKRLVLLKNLTGENRAFTVETPAFGKTRITYSLLLSHRCTECHSNHGLGANPCA